MKTILDMIGLWRREAVSAVALESRQHGAIKTCNLADFAVLEADCFEVDPMALKDIRV